MPDADLTELVDIDASRIDLVKNPANGFPILLMKALSDPAKPDETPDTSGTDIEKDTEVPEPKNDTETSPAPEAPEVTPDAPVEKSLGELVKEEVAKAVEPLKELNTKLEAEMALLKSTPIPGGPMVTVPGSQRSDAAKATHLAEAQHFENLAKDISGNAELVRYYEEKAAEARRAANGLSGLSARHSRGRELCQILRKCSPMRRTPLRGETASKA